MEYPNGLRRTSSHQPYIRAAHQARSAEFYRLIGMAARSIAAAVGALSSPLARGVRHLNRERRLRAAKRELQALDDRLLADMGISRDDIDEVVRNGRPTPNIAAEQAHPHEAKRAAEVVELRREPDLMGALIIHGPWGRYSDRRRNDAA
ncbi:DUF1127 domain-containing protein [Dichotomicrobium thermohalophilum]|uniref:Uncharacterized protein DUF1127 n=1 Tax=Dichotomicrobium thermohalophilum TaxID=933063 RepID=A0A397Q7F3_9HYPH|nr:DUF1127 domain-containing protein [Dichotomicrobium thermohalophilum]RIA56913.1 uncharacterized protein DUF1127 [Dichotomicrobium thermohalophilum]